MNKQRRIGILGGSFNPVHVGHMMIAQYMVEFGGLDEVWLLLSPHNPLKEAEGLLPDEVRLTMLELACNEVPSLSASDFEFHLPRPSYTYITLQELQSAYPDADFTLLIGADNWQIFNRWRCGDFIVKNFDVIIYPRQGCRIDEASLPERVTYRPDAPIVEVSSTFIRNAIASGHCVNQFLPAGVYNYIKQNHLYDK